MALDPTASTSAADDSESALELPPAPRAISPHAKRRSWNEKSVRIWVILTAMIAAATSYFAIRDISAARYERRLIFHGTKVTATVLSVDEYERPGRSFPLEQPRRVRMQYKAPAGEDVIVHFNTPGRERGRIEVDDKIELRADPDDPDVVTMQTTPRSWISSLTVVILLAPVAMLLAIITLMARRKVLHVWTHGQPAIGTVVDTHRSGIAPRSDIVRFTVNDIEDRRVFSTLYPHSHGQLQAGDELALVMPKNAAAKAIVAELYV